MSWTCPGHSRSIETCCAWSASVIVNGMSWWSFSPPAPPDWSGGAVPLIVSVRPSCTSSDGKREPYTNGRVDGPTCQLYLPLAGATPRGGGERGGGSVLPVSP